MKLFKVSVEVATTVVVVAENEAQAQQAAEENIGSIIHNEDPDVVTWVAGEVKAEEDFPLDWEEGCVPYSARSVTKSMTLEDWLEVLKPELPLQSVDCPGQQSLFLVWVEPA